MKISRVLAASVGAAMVGASALAFTAPASAEDFPVPTLPLPAEASTYADAWFVGGGSVGSSAYSAYGLDIQAGPLPQNTYQILHGAPAQGGLVDLVNAAQLYVTQGGATLQIPVFGEPTLTGTAREFTTLRPVEASVPGEPYIFIDAEWVTSRAFGSFAAGAVAPLADFEAELAAGLPYEILAVGAAVGNGESASISGLVFGDDTYSFLDLPAGTLVPKTITQAGFATTGINIALEGFAPNEPIFVGLWRGESGNELGTGYVTDANGSFVSTITAEGIELGDYEVIVYGQYSGLRVAADLAVVTATVAVPAPAAAAPAQLAATGTDLSTGVIAGGLLLLAGAGFALFATRRRFGNQA